MDKKALQGVKKEGPRRRLVGGGMDGPPIEFNMTKWPVGARGRNIGRVTSAIHSPRLKKNIGYAMIPIEFSDVGSEIEIVHPSGPRGATVFKKPFIAPGKALPQA